VNASLVYNAGFDTGEDVMIRMEARHAWTNPYLMSDGKADWVRT